MKAFKYTRPDSVSAAELAINGGNGKTVISAGGTDLLGTLKDKIHPEYVEEVVSLKSIADLDYIKEGKNGVSIGAMTKLADIQNSKLLAGSYALLSEAAHSVASPQLRHMATIGGNICQEPRCWYYRYPDNKFDCMRKEGPLCNAMYGNNKYHSIFGAVKVCETPCKTECPNETDIPEYFDLVRTGDIAGAAKLLLSVNPLAATTGRVCPHTCENGCNRNEYEEGVSIRDIEKFVGDFILDNEKDLVGEIPEDTGKKIAIVGSGPAGLTAAFYLRKAGHAVTIFDDNEKPGGMLVYGIPAYRLPKNVVEKIVKMLTRIGVVFKQKIKLGVDVKLADLQKEYDAILLGIGAWESTKMGCPGEDAAGVIGGIEFLFHATNKGETGMGKTVAVIGGGNTAMDACRTALRLGAKKVYNYYRRTQAEMPADEEEIVEGTEEGVEFRYLAAPVEIIKNKKGHVNKIKLQKMKLGKPDESGRRRPEPIKGETETVDVDTVIVAVGQGINAEGLDGIGLNKKSEIVYDKDDHSTNLNKVFAAGDAALGPGTVIETIASARKAAKAIDRFLGGDPQVEEVKTGQSLTFSPESVEESQRLKVKVKAVDKRTAYDEDARASKLDDIIKEANRCFNCGCVAVSPSDLAPAIIALGGVIVTTKREIRAGEFFKAGLCSSTVLDEGEIVTEIRIPKPTDGSIQFYSKFRYRKSIDFPVLGVAAKFVLKGGKFKDVKLVASAVSPTPKEFGDVEAFLIGKKPTARLAEEAADLAIRDALPLAENRYKVTIMRALVRRAVAKTV